MTKSEILIFEAGRKAYAFPIAYIQEVLDMPTCTAVPLGPECLVGLANYKNTILPVYSMKDIFSQESTEKPLYCLVVEGAEKRMGCAVRNVRGIYSLHNSRQASSHVDTWPGGVKSISVVKLEEEEEEITILDI